jgi:hypothetical protein
MSDRIVPQFLAYPISNVSRHTSEACGQWQRPVEGGCLFCVAKHHRVSIGLLGFPCSRTQKPAMQQRARCCNLVVKTALATSSKAPKSRSTRAGTYVGPSPSGARLRKEAQNGLACSLQYTDLCHCRHPLKIEGLDVNGWTRGHY